MSFPRFITYHLYLLQLENYELSRYWRLISKKGLFPPKEPLRKKLVWTIKAKLLFGGAVLADTIVTVALLTWILIVKNLISPLFSYLAFPLTPLARAVDESIFIIIIIPIWILFTTTFIFLFHRCVTLLYPLFYTLILVILFPIDHLVKYILITRARKRIASLPHLTIIGIAGSYGKTTMKEVLGIMLAEKFSVVKTPESVNTPVGIARLILKKITKETDVFIVEMGEHYRGDIAYLCRIAPPSIAIITGINEAHLERLQTMERAVATIFEIIQGSSRDSVIVLNADDELAQKHYKQYAKGRETLFYSSVNHPLAPYHGTNIRFDENGGGITFTLREGGRTLGEFTVPFLGRYIIGDITSAWMIGRRLGMTDAELARGVKDIRPIPHRLELMRGERGVLIIDDSYNGNPAGVREAISTLAEFSGRRKVYITPGLVELGERSRETHREIGKNLSKVADLVILIQTSAAPFIAEGLVKNGFPKHAIHWYKTAPEAHAALQSLLKENDVVLFQNDWGDNYV